MNAARRFFASLLIVTIAVSMSSAAAPRTGDDPRESYERGVNELKANKFDAAVDALTSSLEIDPTYAAAYCCRGMAHLRKGELDKAMKDLDDAIRLEPKMPEAHVYRGQ